jgi:alkylglycerol monooxygenase
MTDPIVFAIPIFFATIGLEAWIAKRRGLSLYDVADALTSISIGMLSLIASSFSKILTLGIYIIAFDYLSVFEWSLDSIPAWVLALLLYDFLYYWFHRCSHEIDLLWGAHVVHHSSEYLNFSTALRQSTTSSLFSWAFYLPMAIAGVPPTMFIIVAVINLLYQYVPHTQLIGKLGWVDKVFVTPSNHRVHHGVNDYCIDKNFGGMLVLWDRLFGTFAEERDDEPIVYGASKPLASYNPLWAHLQLYADLWHQSKKTRDFSSKLKIWLARHVAPARTSLRRFNAENHKRYNPHTLRWLRWYNLANFAFLVFVTEYYLANVDGFRLTESIGWSLFLLMSAMSMGAMLENKAWGRWLEQVRLIIMSVTLTFEPFWFGYSLPTSLRLGLIIATLFLAFRLARKEDTLPD